MYELTTTFKIESAIDFEVVTVHLIRFFQVNGFQGILQTSGFLAPGKKFGQLEVYNEENYLGPWDIASSSEVEWSYHWVMWHDVDDDGLLDCMAAR